MLITTEMTLAMRCSECGKMDYHSISRFAFSGRKNVEITCVCGTTKLVITPKNHREFYIYVPCVVCEIIHVRKVSARSLWSDEVTYLFCQETGLELGYLGPDEKVRELAAAYEDDLLALAGELGGDDYFHNAEVMYEVLNCLHDIAEQDSLYCQCGNRHIEVDIFPDRLELHCKECDSVNIIYAETEEDLQVIRQVETIELKRSGFECLDSLANTSKPARKTRRKRNK